MSAVAIGNSFAPARVYAPSVRAARRADAVPNPVAAGTQSSGVRSISDQGLGLVALSASVDHTARVSNELAVADAKLEQIGGRIGADGSTSPDAIDAIARSARFSNRPLLDGSYSATVRGQTFSLPSFLASDLGDDVANRVQQTRQQIDSFRSTTLESAAYTASAAAERLLGDMPFTMDASGARSAALLIRARTLIDPAAVADSTSSRAENVLALIR